MVSLSSDLASPPSGMTTVSEYYSKLESRIGYRVLLGGTRHFGYYDVGTWWPFPIGAALRRMEERLYQALGPPKDNGLVLDGGSGNGDVAIYMAQKGLRVNAIDILDMHVGSARSNVKARGLQERVKVYQMDYHKLAFDDETFDGVYTNETLVHAGDPDQVMREFYRVLKPGGTMVHIEYEHRATGNAPATRKLARINRGSHMPALTQFTFGTIQKKLEQAGFTDVEVQDQSYNVLPMLRMFFVLAIIPYILIRLLGLEARFTNTMAAVEFYRIQDYLRFVTVQARKPGKHDDLYREGGDFATDQMRRRG